MSIQYERGYLILANNNDSVDYLACARALAKSLRWHMPDCKICLLTNDNETDTVFDIIKPYPYSLKGGWHDDWQVLEATPFRETIKLEADMLITGNINHWWNWFEHRDVVVSTGIRINSQTAELIEDYLTTMNCQTFIIVLHTGAEAKWRMSSLD